jgi:hypothetical protein
MQSEAEPNTQNPHTGRETGLNNLSRGPGETAHRGLASGTRRDVRARTTQGRGEYMSGQLQTFFAERGIQQEPTAGYTLEANGLVERHNLTLLDIAIPMLADSGDPQRGLPPLGSQYAGAAVIYANDLHNATPAPSALVGRTPHEGFLHLWLDSVHSADLAVVCGCAAHRSLSKVSA